MATLYWGGGTGTWDGFNTANWYTNVGRTIQSTRAPSAEDDVVFDSASNATAYTVTISSATTVCRNVTIAGPASGNVTLAGSALWYIYGSVTLPATGLTRTFTGQIQFRGTGSHTITTNGVSLASLLTFAGPGTYTLQDALNIGTSNINLNSGTLDTNGKTFTCGNVGAAAGTTAGTLILGSSTVSATTINPNAPLTINAGTSTITLSVTSASIGGGTNYTGNTFYNVTFSSASIATSNLYGNNTFNNLTFTTKSAAGVSNVVLFGNQTVNGTLTITGQSSVNRYFVRSNLVGTTRTLTVNTVGTLTDVDFRDITVAGTASPWSGTRLGDCGGNTNITFPAAKTVYWNGTTGGAWSGNFWATSSGGAVSLANFPLAQDTAVIDDTGYTSGDISGGSGYNIKTLTITKTSGYNIATSLIYYGDLTLAASNAYAGTFTATFAGRVTQNLTSAGNTINEITCAGYNASVKLADNTTVTNWTITSGGFDTNNKSFTVNTGVTVSTTNTGAFTLTLGSSAVSIAGNTGFGSSSTTAPTMTVSAGTSTITLTFDSASFGFAGQTLTWYNVTKSSTGGVIYGNNTFNNLTFSASAGYYGVTAISFAGNQTINGTLALSGGSAANKRLGIYSDVQGTQRTITAAAVTGLVDIDFWDIKGAGVATWTGGTRIGDCGGNSGIGVTAAKTVYWSFAGAGSWYSTAWAPTSGGTPSVNDYPLPQDTAVFNNSGASGSDSVDIDNGTGFAQFNIGTIDASARTVALTISGTTLINIFGNVTYGSGVTASNTGIYTFAGRGTQTYTTAGKSVSNAITINKPAGTFQHGDAYTSTSSITVTLGTYTTQNYNVTTVGISSSNSNTRSITLGTSTVTASGTSPITFTTSTGLTFSGASSTINLSSNSAKTFAGGNQTFGTVSSTGGTSQPITISGSNIFGTLTNSARTYLIFAAGTTQEATTFSYTGASGNVVRWYTSIPGQRATFKGNSGAVGANSVDGGNNSGLTFTGTSPNYFYVKDIAYSANYNGGPNFFAFF